MNFYAALGLIVFAFLGGCWAGFGIGCDVMHRAILDAKKRPHG